MEPDFFFVMSLLWAMLSGQPGCQSSLLGRWLVVRMTASVLVLGLFCGVVCGLLYYYRAARLFEMTGMLFILTDLTLLSTSRGPRCVFNMCQSCFASTWRIYGLPFSEAFILSCWLLMVAVLDSEVYVSGSLYINLAIFWKYIFLLFQYHGFLYGASF